MICRQNWRTCSNTCGPRSNPTTKTKPQGSCGYVTQNKGHGSGPKLVATILGLALVADYDLKPPPIEVWSEEKKVSLCKRLEGRLRSHCGGLLEIVKRRTTDFKPKFCFCGPEHDDWINMEVGFMHRTVFEFLRDERVWKLHCLR
ncbi:hypothetical protein NW767_008594 [Fusarium falciforme]|nr:hypothetical protein NW767_008594 [Fusarium falciforme]